jgi:hypothetical protein
MSGDELVIRGKFEDQYGVPIGRAAVHRVFLGDPPSNCGTSFDLVQAPAHTDDAGQFRVTLSRLDERYSRQGPPGTWRRGYFLVLAAKDARTIGHDIASGDELAGAPVRLVALPAVDIWGRVESRGGLAVAGLASWYRSTCSSSAAGHTLAPR